MAVIEGGHAFVRETAADDTKIEGFWRFGEGFFLKLHPVFVWIKRLGEDPFLRGESSVVGGGIFEELEDRDGIGVGPASIDIAERGSGATHDVHALLAEAAGSFAQELPFAGFALVGFADFDVIAGDQLEILAHVGDELGVGPDEPPGLYTILSALALGVAEVHPEQERAVGFTGGLDAIEDARVPFEGLVEGFGWREPDVIADRLETRGC